MKLTWNSNLGGMLKLTFRQTAFVTPVVVFIENWSPYNNNTTITRPSTPAPTRNAKNKQRTGSTTSNGSGSGAKPVWQNGNP